MLKRLLTIWFHLHESLEKANFWDKNQGTSTRPVDRREGLTTKGKGELGGISEVILYYSHDGYITTHLLRLTELYTKE